MKRDYSITYVRTYCTVEYLLVHLLLTQDTFANLAILKNIVPTILRYNADLNHVRLYE